MNGFNLIAVNEVDKNIMSTNQFNHSKDTPNENFILGDITKDDVKARLIKACEGHSIDVIVGGPPCQGFSYAGWRDPNDVRNQLFKEFVHMVDTLRPNFFVMENVPGILTMRKGEAFKEIVEAFESIGYFVNKPIKLNAEEFGVPQKRKRVFIIGSRNGVVIEQPKPLFSNDDESLPNVVTVKDAIGSLPAIEDGGGSVEMEVNFGNMSPFDRLMQGQITFNEFYQLQYNNN
jgi:DNA (cytosine-5)-methyltransferase 1